MKKKALSVIGVILVFIGAIAATVFVGGGTMADYEALFFEGSWKADEDLTNYNCPALIGRDEVSAVTLNIENSAESVIRPAVRTRISEGFVTLVRQDDVKLEIQPGDKKALSWKFSGEDAAYDRTVYVRIFRFAAYPYKAQYAACGIMVADLGPLTGQQAIWAIVGGSISSMILGIGLFQVGNTPMVDNRTSHKRMALILMAAFVLAGLATIFFNLMFVGVFVFFATVLMILVVLFYFLS